MDISEPMLRQAEGSWQGLLYGQVAKSIQGSGSPIALIGRVGNPTMNMPIIHNYRQLSIDVLHVAPSVWAPMHVRNFEAPLRLVVGVLIIPPSADHRMRIVPVLWLWLAEDNVFEVHFASLGDGRIRAPIVAVNLWAQKAT